MGRPRLYPHISALGDDYETFILDVWGVLHDGTTPYPGVVETLTDMQQAGKTVWLLSNTPSTASTLSSELAAIGIERTLYQGALTSGQVTRDLLVAQANSQPDSQRQYYYIGPEERRNLLEGTTLQPVEQLEQAALILLAGFNDDNKQPDHYDALFNQALRLHMPVFCASPDTAIIKQTGEVIACAGVLAQRYEQAGGEVHYIGKPYRRIYERLLEEIGTAERILAIGDALATDVAGAQGAGLPTLLLAGGLAELEAGGAEPDQLRQLCERRGIFPEGLLARFAWK